MFFVKGNETSDPLSLLFDNLPWQEFFSQEILAQEDKVANKHFKNFLKICLFKKQTTQLAFIHIFSQQ